MNIKPLIILGTFALLISACSPGTSPELSETGEQIGTVTIYKEPT